MTIKQGGDQDFNLSRIVHAGCGLFVNLPGTATSGHKQPTVNINRLASNIAGCFRG